jgi:molecular chaperone DnaJ
MWGIFWGGFWWWSRRQTTQWWNDIQLSIDISFEESYTGVTKKIAYTRLKKIADVEEKTCDTCKGHWRVSQQVQTPFGVMQSQWACPKCHGAWKIYTKNGKELDNGWLESAKETLEIKIPVAIKSGAYIKFGQKWDESSSHHVGDLYIQINVTPSKLYERRLDNLYTKTKISLFDMVLWWEIMVTHPEGKLKIKVPKWTQIGDMIKINNKWFGSGGVFNKKWDLYVIPQVEIPKKLSKSQEKLWQELKKSK